MRKDREIIYDIEDLDHLKQVLLSGKKAIFDRLGKFFLEKYKYKGEVKYQIIFKGESDLKDALWDIHYHNTIHNPDKYSDLVNQLIELKTIVFPGFGRVYVNLQESYKKWHDFHGLVTVPIKPFLRFLSDWEFDRSLEVRGLKIEQWVNPRLGESIYESK